MLAKKQKREQSPTSTPPPSCIRWLQLPSHRSGAPVKLNPIVFTWEIAPWAALTALIFTLAFDLEGMLASPFLASTEAFLPVILGLTGSGTL